MTLAALAGLSFTSALLIPHSMKMIIVGLVTFSRVVSLISQLLYSRINFSELFAALFSLDILGTT